MTTIERYRRLATCLVFAAGVGLSGCGGTAAPGAGCAVDEDALADRIADRVYEQLRREGYVEQGGGLATGPQTRGGERERVGRDGDDGDDGGGAIMPRDIVNALRRGLQGSPSDERGER